MAGHYNRGMVSGSHSGRFTAAGAALALHALALAVVIGIMGPPITHRHPPPVEVALITPPIALPLPPKPLPPNPRPLRRDPRPAASPATPAPSAAAQASSTPPAPPVAIAPARPIDEPRPAAISAQAAPPDAPLAPRVSEPAPATAPAVRETSPTPQRTGPRVDASWSGNAPPPYPAMARRMGEEGEVRLDVQVGTDGQVLDVRLRKSSGSRLLDQTAIETVKKWRFTPATLDGRPVSEWYRDWKWVFKLES